MKKISQHLMIGTTTDAYSILQGITNLTTSVLDITPDLSSSKWRTDKSIILKKVGISGEITKPQIKKINTFIAEQHRQGRAVMICGKTEDKSSAAMLAFLVGHKQMTLLDAIVKVEAAGIEPKLSEKTLETIKKLEVKEEVEV
jgi:hypothetical protein